MTYKYIIEGKIGRYIKNDSFTGLCTDNITSCCIIVLISSDHNKRVMIHGDRSLSKKVIKEQLAWVGNDCEKFIFMRAKGYVNSEGSLIQNPKEILESIWPEDISTTNEIIRIMPEEHEFVFLNNEYNTPDTCPIISQEKIEYHPQAAKLLCLHEITGILLSTALYQIHHSGAPQSSRSNSLYLNPLLLDGNWVDYNPIELNPAIKRSMKTHEITDIGIYSIYDYAKSLYYSSKRWYSNEDFLIPGCGSMAVYYYLNSLSGDSQPTFTGYLQYNLDKFNSVYGHLLNSIDKELTQAAIKLILQQDDKNSLSKLMFTFEYFFNKLSSKNNVETLKGTFKNFTVLIMNTRMLGVAGFVFSNTQPQPAASSSSSSFFNTPTPVLKTIKEERPLPSKKIDGKEEELLENVQMTKTESKEEEPSRRFSPV